MQAVGAAGHLILRLTAGGLMLFHGVAKILGPESVERIGTRLTSLGLPASLAYGVYIGEVLAPLMIILGIYCRIGGLLVAGNMVIAIWLVHMGDLLTLSGNGGWSLELQAFYLFNGVALMLLGSGRFAIKPD